MGKKAPNSKKTVKTLTHDEASRKNIPTAEYQSVMAKEQETPIRVAYERRNRDMDPQLVWRGKDEQDWSDLVTYAPPLYIQEKVHPKVLIDDLLRRSKDEAKAVDAQIDLFADFNGLPSEIARTEFYRHDANWSNRMILGDSLQVMASLAEREGLRGKVQCIYIDPPYGIKFNSNFQWSTTNRDVKDGNIDHITREPEQVKALREREEKTPTAKQPRKESFPQTISPSLSISSTPCRKYSNDSKATTTTRHKPTPKNKHPQKPKADCSSRRGIYPLYAKGGVARYRLPVLQSLVDEWVNLSQQRWGHLSERHSRNAKY
jgi:hypothetical protein